MNSPSILSAINSIIKSQFTKHGQIRVYRTTNFQLMRAGDLLPSSYMMNLPSKKILTLQYITDAFTTLIQDLIDKIDTFEARGTGWMLVS